MDLLLVAAICGVPLCTVAVVWIRLHFQLRGEAARSRHLKLAARELPPGSELREVRADGTLLTIALGASESRATQ